MDNFTVFLQKKLLPAANKYAQFPFINVLRNSVMTIIPLMVLGAIGTFMTNIPFKGIAEAVVPLYPFFNGLSLVTANLSGLLVAISVGYFAAIQYKLDGILGITASLTSFMATQLSEEITIMTANFGATGIFTAIVTGFIAVYIIHLCNKYHLEIKMPDGVPPMVTGTFSLLIPLFISVALFLGMRIGLGLDVNALIMMLFSPLSKVFGTMLGMILYTLFGSLLFLCGINTAVIFGFLIPILSLSTEVNVAAVAAGGLPPALTTWGMVTIVLMGGTGATLGLAVLMAFFAKSNMYKTLGRIALIPSFFNINEPLLYGFPIVFNPVMAIPFIVTPIVNAVTTWLLMSANIIGRAYVDIPWTTPPGISGFLASGGDFRTMIWSIVLVGISMVIYYPFFRISDKAALEKEEAANTK